MPCPIGATDDIMDDINAKGEYGNASIENLDTGHWDDADDTDDEAYSDENDTIGDNANDPIIVLSQQLDMDASRDYEVMNVTIVSTQDLHVGLKFKERKSLRCAVKIYSIRQHHNFRVYYTCARYEEYRCTEYGVTCLWRARACHQPCKNSSEITNYHRPHICMSASLSQDYPKLDSNVISSFIMTMVSKNAGGSIRQVI